MIIIPAIDLRSKKVVRLTQGDFQREKQYSDNPVEVALSWQTKGAELIHVVDLDGAFSGEPRNLDVVEKIAAAVRVPIQLGGGLRTRESVSSALSKGVSRVIIGTKACTDLGFMKALVDKFSDRIAVSIDAAGKGVVAAGWAMEIPKTTAEVADEMQSIGVKTIIFTNVIGDGTLKGLDKQWVIDMLDAAGNANVIIAGGVSSLDDIRMLKTLNKSNLYGVITGKAIYEGTLNLADAIKLAEDM